MKKGFSLIELVFTIVIVAIAIMALPSIVMQTQRSNEMALKQELTLQAKSMMGRVLGASWDSNHINQRFVELQNIYPDCNNTATGLIQVATNKCWIDLNTPIYGNAPRPGTNLISSEFYTSSKRGLSGEIPRGGTADNNITFTETSENNFGKDTFSYGVNPVGRNDIDDYAGNSGNFYMSVTPENGDFLSDMDFITAVTYNGSGFVASSANNDVKQIVVTVTDAVNRGGNFDNSVQLVYFAPNVGDSRVAIKEWQ